MKQYKVIYVNHDNKRISDGEHYWDVGYDTRGGQEKVLNYYGQYGWRLVAAVGREPGSFGEQIYLYLERDT